MSLRVAWSRMSLNLRCVVQHAGLKLEWSPSDYRMPDPKKRSYCTKVVGKHEVTASCPPTCSACPVSIMIPLCNYQSPSPRGLVLARA